MPEHTVASLREQITAGYQAWIDAVSRGDHADAELQLDMVEQLKDELMRSSYKGPTDV